MRIAVVGAGIAGLGAAYYLSPEHEVDVFEREARLGGHAHTHTVHAGGTTRCVDSGFLVYNTRTYPLFTRLLADLGVGTQPSAMSFSVRCRRCALVWGSRNVRAFFADPRHMIDLRHWRFLAGVRGLLRAGRRFLDAGREGTVGAFLEAAGQGNEVARHFLLPMTGAIWSASFDDMRAFPARTILQFLDNHGLLSIDGAPTWRTISGGSARYVEALAKRIPGRIFCGTPVTCLRRDARGVVVGTAETGPRRYDKVVVATHADVALRLLSDATGAERDALGRFRYSVNEAFLHTDPSVLPAQRAAHAAWNCDVEDCDDGSAGVSMTYDITRLQSLPGPTRFCVTLNPTRPIPGDVLARMSYAHPILDAAAVAAQPAVAALNGVRHTYFCGAHLRYGFHEDGLASARAVADGIGGHA